MASGSRVLRLVRFSRRDLVALAVMIFAVIATWCWTYRLWPWQLSTPFEYAADAMFQLGAARAAYDRGLGALWGAVDERLGAPAGARWGDWPISEDAMYLGVGTLGRLFGPVAGLNLAYLGTCVAAAFTMFWVGRRLRLSAPSAALAGALFAMAPYVYWRNLHHFNLTVYWPLPLAILVWVWAAGRRGLRIGSMRFKLAMGFLAIVAMHNVYYLNYALQVLLLIGLLQAVRRRWAAARAVAVLLVTSMIVFALVNADTFYLIATQGRNAEAVNRSLDDLVRFGLRPIELWLPGQNHRIDAWSHFGTWYRPQGTGEFPSMFLGVIAGLGVIGVLVQGLLSLIGLRKPGLAGRFTLFTGWLIVLAVPGGLLHGIQSVLGFAAFRSNNRVSILILGMGVLFVGALLDARWRKTPRVLVGAVIALGVFGLWEQSVNLDKVTFPGGESYASVRAAMARQNSSDAKFGALLEAELPAKSALIQFPPLAFPEGGGAPGMADYEHFRLYIHTNTLRFSYGAMKGRPEAAFNFTMARTPPVEAMQVLESQGFKGAVFRIGAISPQQVEAWASAAATVRPNRILRSETGDWAAVLWQ